jgi:hypothetical protein
MNRKELERKISRHLDGAVARIVSTTPHADHLIASREELNEEYYIRHRIETVWRIRLTAKTDAMALARMIDEDYAAARWWSGYVAEELGHDLLYLADLQQHGLSEGDVLRTPPLPSTQRLLEYMAQKIDELGSLPAVAYSVFVEWNSERVSALAVERASRRFGPAYVEGSRKHTGIDENEKHYSLMLDVVYRLLQLRGTERLLFDLLNDFSDFFAAYFQELHDATLGRRSVPRGTRRDGRTRRRRTFTLAG